MTSDAAASRPALCLDIEDGLATITLTRAEKGNSLTRALADELLDVTSRLSTTPGVRAVLLQAEGRTFSVGGDIDEFTAAEDMPSFIADLASTYHRSISQLVRLDAPVVAAVRGSAAGGGMSLALACDIVIASDTARFLMAYPAIGLTPDLGGSFFLPQLVGIRKALDLALNNVAVGARDALAWGMVTKVVPDDALEEEAAATARALAAGPTTALGATKRLLRQAWAEHLDIQLEREVAAIVAAARTEDAAAGIAAFRSKEQPQFHGR